MTTKAKASKTRPEKRTNAEKDEGRESEDRLTKALAKMTPAERKKQLAQCRKWTRDLSFTTEAAESDLLRWLLIISVEFAKRYYPTATSSGFFISEDHDDGKRRRNVYSNHICVPLSTESAPVASPALPSSGLLTWWASAIATINEIVDDAHAIIKASEKLPSHPLDLVKLHDFAVTLNDLSADLSGIVPRSNVLPDPLAGFAQVPSGGKS